MRTGCVRPVPRGAAISLTVGILVVVSALWVAVPAGSGAMNSRPSPSDGSGTTAYPSRAATSALAPSAGPTLLATGQSPAAIALSWSDGTSGTFVNYSVEEGSAASKWVLEPVQVITSDTTTTTVVGGVSPSVNYTWRVVENYETCFIICNPGSVSTDILNLSQPSVAFLYATGVTSTGATLHWTNNATYGGGIAFDEYVIFEEKNDASPAPVATFSDVSTQSDALTLTSGASYSFFLETTDCVGGCGGSTPVLSTTESNILTLGTPEPLSVTVFADHSTLDLGQSDLFTCTPIGGESPFTYEWNFGNGSYFPGVTSQSAVLASTGTVSVTCKVTDAEPSSASGVADVLVNPPLRAVASLNRSTADEGQAIAYSCTPVNGTYPYSVAWNLGDGTVVTTGNGTHVYSTAGDYAPTCTVTDSADAQVAPAFPLVISPAVSVTASASSIAAAPGTSLNFAAAASNGSGTYRSYNWTFGNGAIASGANVSYAFPGIGHFTVAVAVRDSNGASASGTVTILVSDVAVAIESAPTSATAGSSVTFAAVGSGGAGGPYNYTWDFGDGTIGYGAKVAHAYSKTGTFDPTVTVTDRLGASNSTRLNVVSVAAAPGDFDWLTGWAVLALGAAVALVLALFVFARRRRAEAAELEAAPSSAYVPPTDPKRTIRGRKVCENCGAANLPVRTTCSHCGKPLPRAPS
jgi:hypothetical protein